MRIAFDADVLIYAASQHPLGAGVAKLFTEGADPPVGVGSVLLLTEVLAKPLRADRDSDESHALQILLGHLDLRPFDAPTARLALALAVQYGLGAADAAHLATAVAAGADCFLTNNRKDFRKTIAEIDVTYPDELIG